MFTFLHTAISRKVVGKVHATIPKGIVGGFEFTVLSKKFERMAREAMDIGLRVLKESNKSRFDSYSVRNSVLLISHTTFRDCRVHIFSDNLSRNSSMASFTVQGADEVGTESFFVSVDLLIHSEQYATNTSMAVLIKHMTCKSLLFFFLGTKKSFKLRNLPSRTSTLFLSRWSACPFLNCDQVSSRFTEYSGKLTFYTCSRKARY